MDLGEAGEVIIDSHFGRDRKTAEPNTRNGLDNRLRDSVAELTGSCCCAQAMLMLCSCYTHDMVMGCSCRDHVMPMLINA